MGSSGCLLAGAGELEADVSALSIFLAIIKPMPILFFPRPKLMGLVDDKDAVLVPLAAAAAAAGRLPKVNVFLGAVGFMAALIDLTGATDATGVVTGAIGAEGAVCGAIGGSETGAGIRKLHWRLWGESLSDGAGRARARRYLHRPFRFDEQNDCDETKNADGWTTSAAHPGDDACADRAATASVIFFG
ncbi:hypothetical protein BC940DRAFT_167503 [Gongronella butleri]|nr:hypothetical protein BC940DRAFT_167503 [Gongronella butleri]